MDMVERIMVLSKKQGISGAKLGELLGLQKSPLTDWKNNKARPTVNQLVKLCEIFATTSDYILFGITDNQVPQLNEDADELVKTYFSLDKRGQHKIHTVIYEELDRMKADKIGLNKTEFQKISEAGDSVSKMALHNNLVRK